MSLSRCLKVWSVSCTNEKHMSERNSIYYDTIYIMDFHGDLVQVFEQLIITFQSHNKTLFRKYNICLTYKIFCSKHCDHDTDRVL